MTCVKLSARQFEHPELVEDVARILRESRLNPRGLTLEITESVVMWNARSSIDTFRELKALGVKLAIDDFGIGHSSLSYLKRFPVDYLKTDRSFVEGLGKNSEDKALVSGMLNLGHTLGRLQPRAWRPPSNSRSCKRWSATWPKGTTSRNHSRLKRRRHSSRCTIPVSKADCRDGKGREPVASWFLL